MQLLRELVAVIMFVLGIVFIVDLVSSGFDSKVLLLAVLCFVGAYIVWPSKKKGQRDEGNNFLDILEVVIEAPVEIFMWFLKIIGRLLRRSDRNGSGNCGDGGIDFDI
mgnify:CR=1 FL=1